MSIFSVSLSTCLKRVKYPHFSKYSQNSFHQIMAKTRRSNIVTSAQKNLSTHPPKRIKLDVTSSTSALNHDLDASQSSRLTAAPDSTGLPERVSSPWKVGAHVSSVGGIENTVLNAAAIGANAFALFLKSQRKWTSPPLTPDSITTFKERLVEHGYSSDVILPHGSYLINLGNADAVKREKSYDCFVDDLKRCEQLGLTLYNFHPGSTVGQTTAEKSISFIAECINRAHKETSTVTTVLENMAGAGNIIGGDFSHLAQIIEQVEDKTRVGVCLDTCHMFAAGYDIRDKAHWDATLQKFDEIVGLSYLRGMHLNDSKTAHGSKKDRHENIGIGNIGISAFHHILSDPRVQGIPLVLETPSFERPLETWAIEIKVLNELSGIEVDSVSENLVQGIRNAVGRAEKAGGKANARVKAKAKADAKAKTKAKVRSRKRKAEIDDEDEEA